MIQPPAGTLIGCFQGSCSDRPLIVGSPPPGASIELNRATVTLPRGGIYATGWLVLHGKIIGAYLDDQEPDQSGKVLALRHAGYRGDILAGVGQAISGPTQKIHHALNALEWYPQLSGDDPAKTRLPAGWPAYIIQWAFGHPSHESREIALHRVLAQHPKYVLLY